MACLPNNPGPQTSQPGCQIQQANRSIDAKFDSDPAHLAAVRTAIESLCTEGGFDARATGEIGLVVNEASRFENANVLQTGETKLKFETTHLNENGDKLTVPGLFMVAIPLFIDGAEIRIAARLRYRKAGGSLTWFYNLYRPHVVMRNRLVEDLAHVGEATALPTFEGSPEKR